MTEITHFAILFKTKDLILRPWFVSLCIQNYIIYKNSYHMELIFLKKRVGVTNVHVESSLHTLLKLLVQNHTLLKLPNSEIVLTFLLTLEMLKTKPCSAVYTHLGQVTDCPPPPRLWPNYSKGKSGIRPTGKLPSVEEVFSTRAYMGRLPWKSGYLFPASLVTYTWKSIKISYFGL